MEAHKSRSTSLRKRDLNESVIFEEEEGSSMRDLFKFQPSSGVASSSKKRKNRVKLLNARVQNENQMSIRKRAKDLLKSFDIYAKPIQLTF